MNGGGDCHGVGGDDNEDDDDDDDDHDDAHDDNIYGDVCLMNFGRNGYESYIFSNLTRSSFSCIAFQ